MNMLATIVAKSDQLNADDLMGGKTITVTVTKVVISNGDQPVSVHFEGDDGKPYKPGKSMRRALVKVWGPDADKYKGRSMTLYRDEAVRFGGLDVGGIRISHMSHIDEPITMALTEKKGSKKPFRVLPLKVQQQAPVANPFQILGPNGAVEFATLEEWEEEWLRLASVVPAANLKKAREMNGALMGEYAEDHGEAVMRVQAAIDAKIKGEAA